MYGRARCITITAVVVDTLVIAGLSALCFCVRISVNTVIGLD